MGWLGWLVFVFICGDTYIGKEGARRKGKGKWVLCQNLVYRSRWIAFYRPHGMYTQASFLAVFIGRTYIHRIVFLEGGGGV